jgi:hypothetical protein
MYLVSIFSDYARDKGVTARTQRNQVVFYGLVRYKHVGQWAMVNFKLITLAILVAQTTTMVI